MKKFFAFALALVLTFALSVTCFAAIAANGAGSESKNVTAKYVGPTLSGTVYGVDVKFGDMVFTYNAAAQGTWNPETHAYDNPGTAEWTCNEGANEVTVTNHSNVAITVTVKYENAENVNGITGKFGENATATFDLDAGVVGQKEAADKDTVALTVSGDITSEQNNTAIGTVTVTIAKKG